MVTGFAAGVPEVPVGANLDGIVKEGGKGEVGVQAVDARERGGVFVGRRVLLQFDERRENQ